VTVGRGSAGVGAGGIRPGRRSVEVRHFVGGPDSNAAAQEQDGDEHSKTARLDRR
jgi:hypothetical protein